MGAMSACCRVLLIIINMFFLAVLSYMINVRVDGQDITNTYATYAGQTATIVCPVQGDYTYPSWRGPPDDTIYNYVNDPDINSRITHIDRLSFAANERDLVITNVTVSDAATYRCTTIISETSFEGWLTLIVRIRPQTPVISNVVGTERRPLTLTCTSSGGNPAPTVTWYHGSTRSSALSSSSTGPVEGDGYNVTATYKFTPVRVDDGDVFICQTSHTSPPVDVLDSVNMTLRLNLKPSLPTVQQEGEAMAGFKMKVQCTTSDFRPRTGISMTWTYKGSPVTPVAEPSISSTEPYTATSTIQFTVHKADNGGTAECTVSHPTTTPLTASTTIVVHYAPESVHATGSSPFTANGMNQLTLTCAFVDGHPEVTSFSWRRTSRTGTVTQPASTQTTLVLTPTRDDDGDTITCTADNGVGAVTSGPFTLDLHFHPITAVTVSPPGLVTEGTGTDVTQKCSIHSKPAGYIAWYHNGQTLHTVQLSPQSGDNRYTRTRKITSAMRKDAGNYTCVATNTIAPPGGDISKTASVTLIVRFAPLSASLTGSKEIVADGQNQLTLTCAVGNSNPVSNITWTRTGSVDISNIVTRPDVGGAYGGYTRSQDLVLTITRDDDGETITCTANNGVGPSVIDAATLNLKYSAVASISGKDVTITEGDPTTALACTATGKPAPTFTWYKDGQAKALESGPGTWASNQWTYTYSIPDVHRGQAGQYRCLVDNRVGSPGTAVVELIVQYPPYVEATATVNGQYVDLACSPSGVPSIYLYSSWVQTWPGYGEITRPILEAAATLRLSNLSYAHSGVYTCRVSNGVAPYGTSGIIRTASTAALTIESRPVIVTPSNAITDINKFAVKLDHTASVTTTYYSPSTPTLVSCYKVIGNVRQSPPVGTVTTESTHINLPIFSSSVPTLGTRSTVTWIIVAESGLGVYDIVVSNAIGDASVLMAAVMEGPPDKPEHFKVLNIQPTRIDVSWQSEFHGGYPQTAVVQYSTDGVTWIDGPSVDTGVSVSRELKQVAVASLSPGTHYYLRMYTHNELGSSPYTYIHNVTTGGTKDGSLTDACGVAASSFGEGAVTGAAAATAVIVVGVIVIGVLYKKRYRRRHGEDGTKYTGSEQTYVNDTMMNEVQGQHRGIDSALSDNYIVPKSDTAPAVYEMLDSAGTVDSATYTDLALYESTNTQQKDYENMKI